jgi:CSLREA domain-containing protein
MPHLTFPRCLRSAAVLPAAIGALLLSGGAPAAAKDYAVTKTADTADGSCDADCSLREAVQAASAAPDADLITLGAGDYELTRWDSRDGSTDGDLVLSGVVTIRGAGPAATTVRLAVGEGRYDGVFDVTGAGTRAVFEDFTVSGGNWWGIRGGGISARAGADLTLRRMIVRDNATSYNAGRASGGGVFFDGGELLVEDSAFLGNTAAWGGGIAVESGSATVANTTFIGNTVRTTGGAISANGGAPVALRHVTIAGNTSSGGFGGAIGGNPAGVTIQSSVVSGNGRPECDANGALRAASLGGNVGPLADTDSTCKFSAAAGDLLVSNPGLAGTPTIGGNGIPVLLPLAGSHAIGAVTATCPLTDATGRARPAAAPCSAGAAEPLPGTSGPADPDAPRGETPDGGTGVGRSETGTGGGATDTPAPVVAAPVAAVRVAADTTAPLLALPKQLTVDARRKRASLALTCPRRETRCVAAVQLENTRKVRGKRRTQRLAAGTIRLSGGTAATVRLTLTRQGRAALAGRRSARVTLRVTVRDVAGNRRVQERRVTLRVASR